MNFDGNGYVYADQRAAEQRVAQVRASYVGLIEVLEDANETIDSLHLHQIIEDAKAELRAFG